MIDSFSQWLCGLIGAAFVSAFAECFVKRPALKTVLRLVASVCLTTMLLSGFLKLSYLDYASATRSMQVRDIWNRENSEAQDRELKRRLIEAECCAYIENKASQLGIPIQSAEVTLRWDTKGFWVPERTKVTLASSDVGYGPLKDAIASDLGVFAESQEWRSSHEV